jgi:LacI family gluconate utilization system Gnt-I transcriptional repressor
MGRHAVTMVIDAIEGRRPQQPVLDLGFQLMIRESSMMVRESSMAQST